MMRSQSERDRNRRTIRCTRVALLFDEHEAGRQVRAVRDERLQILEPPAAFCSEWPDVRRRQGRLEVAAVVRERRTDDLKDVAAAIARPELQSRGRIVVNRRESGEADVTFVPLLEIAIEDIGDVITAARSCFRSRDEK